MMTKNRVLVFDLDGVIASYDNKLFHKMDDYDYYSSRKLIMNPDEEYSHYKYSILTGRPPTMAELTYNWLWDMKVRHYLSVYFVGNNRLYDECKGKQKLNWRYHNYVAFQKMQFLKILRPYRYYDDNAQVIATMRDVIPEQKVILCKKKN